MEQGTIRKLINKTADENGGKASAFGFIRDAQGDDLFFLPSTMQETTKVPWESLKVGEKVEFTLIVHPKGPRAIEVRVLR